MAQVYEHDRKTEDIINCVLGEPAGNGYCQHEAAYSLLCWRKEQEKSRPYQFHTERGDLPDYLWRKVRPVGLEPTTCGLKVRSSTN